jgi:hypothetical protein
MQLLSIDHFPEQIDSYKDQTNLSTFFFSPNFHELVK